MVDTQAERLMAAYPTIYLACHREHTRADEAGKVLSKNQASVLNHLDSDRPMTPSKLAEHMGVGGSTIGITVARLERRGFIKRRRNPKNRRSVALTLTPAGKRIKKQSAVLNPKLVRKIFTMMKSEEAEEALAGVEHLTQFAAVLLKRRKRERGR
jgi:DNA-binding MarR family transcriptional regulator